MRLEVRRDAMGVTLSVEDDGGGMPSRAASNRLSHGIAGMRQRVRAFEGRFTIRSRPGAGTTIEAFIPLEADLSGEAAGLIAETVTSWPAAANAPGD